MKQEKERTRALDTSDRKRLTISIAGYNVEAYIGRTLDLLSRCACRDVLEVLAIDDGEPTERCLSRRNMRHVSPTPSSRSIKKTTAGVPR